MKTGQWERVGKAGVTSRNHPWAYCYNHWRHESGSEDEGQWPNVLSTCRLSNDSHPTWRRHRIGVVFDTHREDSIKNAERSNRGCTTWIQFRNMAPGHQIQQWSTANKANRIRFFVAEWKTFKVREKLNDKQLAIRRQWGNLLAHHQRSVGRGCRPVVKPRKGSYKNNFACSSCRSRRVQSYYSNTDVIVLCLAFSTGISRPVFQKCGIKNRGTLTSTS